MPQRRTKPLGRTLAVLLEHDRTYGYEVLQATGLRPGSLYPILVRLEEDGWVRSRWEDTDPSAAGRPRRRYYRLTAAGRKGAVGILQHLGMGVPTGAPGR